MSPGQTPGRTRGAIRAVVPHNGRFPAVGPTWRSEEWTREERRRDGSTDRGVAPGSQVQGTIAGHTGDLGWGIWTNGVLSGYSHCRQLRAGSSSEVFHDVDGGGGGQSGIELWGNR